AARRTESALAKPWCSSMSNWRGNLITVANRAASSRRKCVSFPRRGSGCCRTARGCVTRWRSASMPIRGLPRVQVAFPVETNAVFAAIHDDVVQALHQRGWKFYTNVGVDYARLMCSWDTTKEDVDSFAADLKELTAK